MLLVRTRLGFSRRHGIGLFAGAPIPKGTVVWHLHPAIDLRLSPETLAGLSPACREQLSSYVYQGNRTHEFILCGDDARFFNHDEDPNVVDDANDPYTCIAARNISEGEELTHDYFSFDLLAEDKLHH